MCLASLSYGTCDCHKTSADVFREGGSGKGLVCGRKNAAKNAAKIIPITAKAAPGLRNGADRYSTVG